MDNCNSGSIWLLFPFVLQYIQTEWRLLFCISCNKCPLNVKEDMQDHLVSHKTCAPWSVSCTITIDTCYVATRDCTLGGCRMYDCNLMKQLYTRFKATFSRQYYYFKHKNYNVRATYIYIYLLLKNSGYLLNIKKCNRKPVTLVKDNQNTIGEYK